MYKLIKPVKEKAIWTFEATFYKLNKHAFNLEYKKIAGKQKSGQRCNFPKFLNNDASSSNFNLFKVFPEHI